MAELRKLAFECACCYDREKFKNRIWLLGGSWTCRWWSSTRWEGGLAKDIVDDRSILFALHWEMMVFYKCSSTASPMVYFNRRITPYYPLKHRERERETRYDSVALPLSFIKLGRSMGVFLVRASYKHNISRAAEDKSCLIPSSKNKDFDHTSQCEYDTCVSACVIFMISDSYV